MVELVDTTDLKSVGPNGPCGFKSRSGYHQKRPHCGRFAVVKMFWFDSVADLAKGGKEHEHI